ncbi:MAG: hypothetical protein K0U84_00680 [Actinomycetia bacterium]|nr:hypothetical protein [Actinomycetes bacterium]
MRERQQTQQSEIKRLDALARRPRVEAVGIDWGRAVFGGAIAAGVLWGYLLATPLKSDITNNQYFPPEFLLIAAAYCAGLLLLGGLLISLTKNQHLRTFGAAVAVAGGIGPLVTPWGIAIAIVGLLAAYGVVRRRQHRAPRRDSLPDFDSTSQSRISAVRDSPAPLLAGLALAAVILNPLWLIVAYFACIPTLAIGLLFLASRRTAAFGAGLLAGVAGATTLVISLYVTMAIVG